MCCSRCGASPPESDWAEPAGLCVDCVLGVAAEQEPPDLPELEILGKIGRGGMGVVYRARQILLRRIVAVKVMASASGAEFEERFAREARLLSQLDHPGIVTLHDFGLHEGVPYFVMEHVDGTSLREMLGQRLPVGRALELAEEVLAALAFAHARGIVHRDIKPENVLVDSSGRVKVTDFGLAKFAPEGEERLTRPGVVMGTPAYMAPEQLERPDEVDSRADLYAVGAMLYEMLNGELPVGRFRRPGVSRAIDAAVLRLLAHRPADRPATAELAAADLRRARLRRPRRAWPAAAIVASVAIVLLVLFVRDSVTTHQWVDLGGSATGGGISRTPTQSNYPHMAARGGRVAVCWLEITGGRSDAWLRLWDGERWVELDGSATGSGVSRGPGAGKVRSPVVAIDPDGRPVMVWWDTASGNEEVRLRRWNGSAWIELGESSPLCATEGASTYPALAIDARGHPIVAWVEYLGPNRAIWLRRWNGEAWESLAGSSEGRGISGTPALSGPPNMVLDGEGRPVLAWTEEVSGRPQIWLRRWDGASWIELGGSATGGGVSASPISAAIPRVVLDRDEMPVVCWIDERTGTRQIHVRRWDGRAWVDLGESFPGWLQSLTVLEDGRLLMAYEYEGDILARAWDGSAWRALGNLSGTPLTSRFSVASGAIVAWAETTQESIEIYLRQLK